MANKLTKFIRRKSEGKNRTKTANAANPRVKRVKEFGSMLSFYLSLFFWKINAFFFLKRKLNEEGRTGVFS